MYPLQKPGGIIALLDEAWYIYVLKLPLHIIFLVLELYMFKG